MSRKRVIWVDVGMVVAVGIYVSIVIFARGEDYYAAALVAYLVGLALFAFVAEVAQMRFEASPRRDPAKLPGDLHRTHLLH